MTPEDEAFDELAKRQGAWGGGFQAKRRMAADKVQEPWNEDEWRKNNWRCQHGWLRGEQCEICNAPKRQMAADKLHWSDCAVHNAPAYPAGKCDCGAMNDRQRLEAIVSVINKYLPPDGIHINEAMSEIISLVDPLPPQRPWVGLTQKEVQEIHDTYHKRMGPQEFALTLIAKLQEKNNGT